MKRGWLTCGSAVLLLGAAGCIAANVRSNRFGSGREALVIDGQLYVVDPDTGDVMKLDHDRARPFVPTPPCD